MSPVFQYDPQAPNACGTLHELGIDLVYFAGYQNHVRTMHSVDVLLLSCILEGQGTHYIESDTFEEGGPSVAVINYGQEHDVVTNGPMEIMNVFLDPETLPWPEMPFSLQPVLPQVIPLHPSLRNRLNRVIHLTMDPGSPVRGVLFALRRELQNRSVGYEEVWKSLFQAFLVYCARAAVESEIVTVPPAKDPVMERVRQYITGHFAEPLTLEQLAQVAGTSSPYLCRRFKRYTGQSVFTYLLDRRIEAAIVRLRSTNDTIVTVAMESGFRDVAFFNRKFRSRIGTSPGRYRSAEQEKE